MRDSFAHLHVHTEFSMLDGAARLDELVAKAIADGQPAIGITDHGNMYGVIDFYKECLKNGIKPVIGTEAYMAHDHRSERPTRRGRADDSGGDTDTGGKLYYHLTLLAESNAGYRNLIQLASRAFLEGYYYKPRLDWELLADHAEGVIATTGCLGGHVLQALLRDDVAGATERAARLQDIFGRDNLFVELQDHGIAEQRRTNPQLIDLARRIGAPLLATNDSHYTHREDHEAHDALLCVQTGSMLSDPKRFKFEGQEHYLKTADEMRWLFRDHPEACDNTLWIAERADVAIEFGKVELPDFPLPEGFATADEYLAHLTWGGARRRWGDELSADIEKRLRFELDTIASMGFSAYFLIVWDLIAHARRNGIRVGPGRGSAAGCAVAYCLWITDLDPIRYDLLFERFLNPSRVTMPDIDMDFDSRFRDEMIRYASEKYGRDHVAQIITFGTIKARNGVRDAARVLGMPYAVGDRIAKAMPPLVMGRDTPLKSCFEAGERYADGYKAAAELRAMYDADPEVKRVVDVARGLEGLKRSDGIHAAAVVITKEPLTTYLPVQRKPEPGQDPTSAPVITQYEMHGVDDLGLLKMDFLGLRNLDVITDTVAMIRARHEPDFDVERVPLDDPQTYEVLQRGSGIGVFQLEGGPMRALMRTLRPTNFEDVAALLALYRPGPMAANMHTDYADRKNGRKPIAYDHDDLAEVLGDTYGLMVYQESMMRVAQRIAGYSLADADNLRRACLPAGTRIVTRTRGYVAIEDVMKLADHRVQTIDTTSCVSRHEEVDEVWSVGVKPVYRLTTLTGYTIEATADHPFLVEGEWRQLGDIQPGDLVGVAARTETQGGSKVSMAAVELAALLISEGYTPDPRVQRSAHFCNTDPDLLNTFRTAFERHFDRPPRPPIVTDGVTRIHLTRHDLLALEPYLGAFGKSADKRIPDIIVNASAVKVARFLGLYFCADGWADASGCHFASKSEAVCRALKRMLLRFGIVSNLNSRIVEGHGRHWTLSICDKFQTKAFARLVDPHLTTMKLGKVERWMLGWADVVNGSATNIGIPVSFVAAELARRQQVTGRTKRQLGMDGGTLLRARVVHRNTLNGLLYSERLEDLRTGDLVWDTVRSVEYSRHAECFDFRMTNDERPYAVVEDFALHNCGKKSRQLIAVEREKFIDGADRMGYGRSLGSRLFDIIEPFADYAFGKSHAFGYALVAYQTAYLKAHYPVDYLACLLTSVKNSLEKAAVYIAECRALGIKVLPPDVNVSHANFTAMAPDEVGDGVGLPANSPGAISFGLSAVRNVGEGLVALLLEERQANGPYASFHDFADRVPEPVLNKRAVESLIKAGAFDALGHRRRGLLGVFEQVVNTTLSRRREREAGVMSLFGNSDDASPGAGEYDERLPVPDLEFEKPDLLRAEKEMLGLYVSDHPLFGKEAALRRKVEHGISELDELDDGTTVHIGGVVTGLSRRFTKRGEQMATFVLEDLAAEVEVTLFPRTLAEQGYKVADDLIVAVRGRLDKRDESRTTVICQTLEVLSGLEDGAPTLTVSIPAVRLGPVEIDRLKHVLSANPGPSPVVLDLGTERVRLTDEFCVDLDRVVPEIRMAFGHGAIAL